MSEQQPPLPAACWYPDGRGAIRYWDGQAWTQHVQPTAPAEAPWVDWCARYQGTLFDFDRYRRPEVYGRITAQRGVIRPD